MAHLTHIFLHGNLLHLLFNLWSFWILGSILEHRMPQKQFLSLFLGGGVAAALAQLLFVDTPAESLIPMVGASGAIAAFMGAALVLVPRKPISLVVPILFFPLFIPTTIGAFTLVWFSIQLLSGLITEAGSAVGA